MIRENLRSHLGIQNDLTDFNNSFSSFLLLLTVDIFSMAICLIYSVIKVKIEDINILILFAANSGQFLFRAFIILYIFGQVQCKMSFNILYYLLYLHMIKKHN